MDEPSTCAICGNPIDVGEAWMEADREGAHIRAHVECLYRDEPGTSEVAWEPQEHAAT